MTTSDTQSRAELSVSYHGDAVEQNIMDVRYLAPSLLALGELFTRANDILNASQTTISLGVQATQRGSFVIQLTLDLTQIAGMTSGLLMSTPVQSAANLATVIIGASSLRRVGLFGFLKWRKGKNARIVERSTDGVVFEADNVRLTIPNDVFRLSEDRAILRRAAGVVEPLLSDGIDRVVMRSGADEDTIFKEEAELLEGEQVAAQALGEYTIPNIVLRLVAPRFGDGKWQLNDGDATRWYTIEDQLFLQQVDQGESFAKGDYLVCRVRVTQTIGVNQQLSQERSIEEVLEHKKGLEGLEQLTMF